MLATVRLLWLIARPHFVQRPIRTLLTIAGVALGVSASVAVRTANLEVLKGFENAVLTVAGPATLEVTGGELGLDESIITRVRQAAGVIAARPVSEQGVAVIAGTQAPKSLVVMGLDLLEEAESSSWRIANGAEEESLDQLLSPESIFLGRRVADELGVTVGSPLTVQVGTRLVQLRLAGIIEGKPGAQSVWDQLGVMDIAAAQVTFDMVGKLDRIDLVTSEERSIEEVAQAVRAIVPPHVTVERPASRTKQVEQMVRAFRLNLTVLSWVGLLVGIFLIYNTLAFAVAQRRREIGIYRAIGMTQARVAVLFLAEAAVLGLLGGMIGSLAGLLLAEKLIVLVSRTISDLYVPVGMGESLLFRSSRLWEISLEGMLIGCLVSMIGAIGPSLDASRTATARALAPGDYEASRQLRVGWIGLFGLGLIVIAGGLSFAGPVGGMPVFGYLATFCLLAGLSCVAPMCVTGWRRRRLPTAQRPGLQGAMREIAVDHAARNPGRNGVTVSALMVGLAIMIGVVIMVRSFRHTVELWINDTVIADVVVAPSSWLQGSEVGSGTKSLPPSWLSILSSVPEVAAVDTYRGVRIEVKGQRVAIVSRDLRLHARRSRYLVRQGDSSEQLNRAAESGGILVSEVLADRLGVHEGQSLEIMTPEGAKRFPIVAVFYDYATDGGKLVMDRSLYRSLWHDELVTVFPVYLAAGSEVDQVRKKISAKLNETNGGGLPPMLISNAELRKEILDIFDRTFLLTYVLEAIAVIIAMLGIVNTLVTSVVERRREFATLRAIGGSEGQIRQLVLWEAAYLGVVGIGLGLIGGGLLSLLLIKVINKQSFGWTIQMILPIGALVQAVGLAAVATLIAGYFPARWAARQPVVEGLREE